MEKPTILKIKEMEEEIVKIINNSQLPIYIVEASIDKIHGQLIALKNQETVDAVKKYSDAIKKESDTNGNR